MAVAITMPAASAAGVHPWRREVLAGDVTLKEEFKTAMRSHRKENGVETKNGDCLSSTRVMES